MSRGNVPRAPIRLYDALSYLSSAAGRPLLLDLEKEIKDLAFQREQDPLAFYPEASSSTRRPDLDPFRVQVMEHCFDDHYELKVSRALPVGIIRALSQAADRDGIVHAQEVGAKLGPYAALLTARLESALAHFERPELPLNTKYETADEKLRELVARSMPRDYGAARMPLLGEVTEVLGGPETFRGWRMASLSHLFATRPALYAELDRNGLAPADHLVSGKGYSRNMDVVVSLAAYGRNVDESLLDAQTNYDEGASHEDARAKAVLTKLFDGVPPDSDQRFLLLDDGGNLVVALHRHFPEHAHLCRVVEQTDHGLQRIEREIGLDALKCPVVNVARSWLKKLFESPVIGEAVMHSVDAALREIHPKLDYARKEGALLGFGAVNQAVAKAMERRDFKPENIWVWDPDPEKRALALQRGYRVPDTEDEAAARLEVLHHGYLTITATGRQTLSPDEFGALPPYAIVANGGSGNHELGMHEVDNQQRQVAPVGGDRHYRRVVAPKLEGQAQIEAFLKIALDRLAYQDAMNAVPAPRTASILGYDAGGKAAIQRLLASGFKQQDIVVSDRDPTQKAEALRDGFRVAERHGALRHGSIAVSNPENAVTEAAELALLPPEAIHVQHGPNPLELGSEQERASQSFERFLPELHGAGLGREQEFFRGHLVNNAVGRAGEAYRHRVLQTGEGNEILVLRSGYVINMETGIPPEYVQLILSMLLAGLIQATHTTEPGLHELTQQDFMHKRFERCLDRVGLSLEQPSFAGLRPAI